MGSAETFLRNLGVTNFVPGFQDDPAFLAAESKNPRILEKYSEYIEETAFASEYLSKARERITKMVKFLHPLLVKNGRLGACVDASGALARMLERDGIWCYVVKGALSIYPAPWLGIPSSHFAPITSQGGRTAAHAWVVAPPFRVIDLTIKQQPEMTTKQAKIIPDYVLSESMVRVESEPEDWIDPPDWPSVVRSLGYEPTMDDVEQIIGPVAVEIANQFGAWEQRTKNAAFRYVTLSFGGFQEKLEDIKHAHFGNRISIEVYDDFCKMMG